jgi:hypothetical protein
LEATFASIESILLRCAKAPVNPTEFPWSHLFIPLLHFYFLLNFFSSPFLFLPKTSH